MVGWMSPVKIHRRLVVVLSVQSQEKSGDWEKESGGKVRAAKEVKRNQRSVNVGALG